MWSDKKSGDVYVHGAWQQLWSPHSTELTRASRTWREGFSHRQPPSASGTLLSPYPFVWPWWSYCWLQDPAKMALPFDIIQKSCWNRDQERNFRKEVSGARSVVLLLWRLCVGLVLTACGISWGFPSDRQRHARIIFDNETNLIVLWTYGVCLQLIKFCTSLAEMPYDDFWVFLRHEACFFFFFVLFLSGLRWLWLE